MNKPIIDVRLVGVSFKNIKNIADARIVFPIETDADKNGRNNIFGIYGPNGTGKTSLINSLSILKSVLCEIPLDVSVFNVMNVANKSSSFVFEFNIKNNEEQYFVEYSFSIEKQTNDFVNSLPGVSVSNECVKYKKTSSDENLKKLISVDLNGSINVDFIKPEKLFLNLMKNPKFYSDVIKLAISAKATHKSFVFSQQFLKILNNSEIFDKSLFGILNQIKLFGIMSLFVIDQINNNNISLNLGFRHIDENGVGTSLGVIGLGINCMRATDYKYYKKSIQEANLVLEKIIPGLSIETSFERSVALQNGEAGISFQLISKRDGKLIPFSCESNGIRSIFSALSLLIAAYNDPSVCLAIDEFDAGVFEHLLGSIVKIYAESGKGLFIFTSHNLRPLEILPRSNVYFTTNEEKLFDTARYTKKELNRRNLYLRSLALEDDTNLILDNAKEYEIKNILRRIANGDDSKK